jgi:RsiW-degrading membrane proteinase PrsW (M82 family)
MKNTGIFIEQVRRRSFGHNVYRRKLRPFVYRSQIPGQGPGRGDRNRSATALLMGTDNRNRGLSIMLSILGLVVIVVSTYLVYKTAHDNGRSGVLWAVIICLLGIVLQFVIPTLVTAVLVFMYYSSAPSSSVYLEQQRLADLQTYATIVSIAGLVLSLVGMWAIMKYVSRIPEDDPAASAPPPPPTF